MANGPYGETFNLSSLSGIEISTLQSHPSLLSSLQKMAASSSRPSASSTIDSSSSHLSPPYHSQHQPDNLSSSSSLEYPTELLQRLALASVMNNYNPASSAAVGGGSMGLSTTSLPPSNPSTTSVFDSLSSSSSYSSYVHSLHHPSYFSPITSSSSLNISATDGNAFYLSLGESGNWRCDSCGNVNFARRVVCHRCRLPKMLLAATAADSSSRMSTTELMAMSTTAGVNTMNTTTKAAAAAADSPLVIEDGATAAAAVFSSSQSSSNHPSASSDYITTTTAMMATTIAPSTPMTNDANSSSTSTATSNVQNSNSNDISPPSLSVAAAASGNSGAFTNCNSNTNSGSDYQNGNNNMQNGCSVSISSSLSVASTTPLPSSASNNYSSTFPFSLSSTLPSTSSPSDFHQCSGTAAAAAATGLRYSGWDTHCGSSSSSSSSSFLSSSKSFHSRPSPSLSPSIHGIPLSASELLTLAEDQHQLSLHAADFFSSSAASSSSALMQMQSDASTLQRNEVNSRNSATGIFPYSPPFFFPSSNGFPSSSSSSHSPLAFPSTFESQFSSETIPHLMHSPFMVAASGLNIPPPQSLNIPPPQSLNIPPPQSLNLPPPSHPRPQSMVSSNGRSPHVFFTTSLLPSTTTSSSLLTSSQLPPLRASGGAHVDSMLPPPFSPLQVMLLKAKDVADKLTLDFQNLGDTDSTSKAVEVLKTSLAILGSPCDQSINSDQDALLQGVGGPNFSAPTMLAHPDEFKNPSSFLKIYGDPRCAAFGMTCERGGGGGQQNPLKGHNGNWNCEKCKNVNFPRRFRCNKCLAARGDDGDRTVAEYAKTVYHQHLRAYKAFSQTRGFGANGEQQQLHHTSGGGGGWKKGGNSSGMAARSGGGRSGRGGREN